MNENNSQDLNESENLNLDKDKGIIEEKKAIVVADKVLKELIEWFICLFVAFLIAMTIKYSLGTFTTVKQKSMFPTLVQNDRLWLDRTVRTFKKEYKVGDIATFEAPDFDTIDHINNNNPKAIYTERKGFAEKFTKDFLEISKKSYIKRIIAKEGDRVQIGNGMILVNNDVLVEDYLDPDMYTEAVRLTDFIVPENTFFMVGDNRKNSTDSRSFGCIPIEKMEGRVSRRFLPFKSMGKIPTNFFEINKLNNK